VDFLPELDRSVCNMELNCSLFEQQLKLMGWGCIGVKTVDL
jgi:hypothetical protein